jgi:hypothetical protein
VTAPETLPPWVKRMLETDPDGLVGRVAKLRPCRSCRRLVWRGRDQGAFVEADWQPTTPLGEVLALMAGRGTYRLVLTFDGYELMARDPWTIKAGRSKWPVVARHVCGAPALPAQVGTILDKPERPGADPNGPPPF